MQQDRERGRTAARAAQSLIFLALLTSLGSARAQGNDGSNPGDETHVPTDSSIYADPRGLFKLAFGFGDLFIDERRRGSLGVMGLGQRLGGGFYLREEYVLVSGEPYSSSPVVIDDVGELTIGFRWQPFGRRQTLSKIPSPMPLKTTDVRVVYVELLVGVAIRERKLVESSGMQTSDLSVSPMLTGSLGWLPAGGDDYAFGVELRGLVSRYPERTRYGLDVIFLAQLEY